MVIEMAISSMPFLIFGLICIIISGSSLYFTVGKLIEIKKKFVVENTALDCMYRCT